MIVLLIRIVSRSVTTVTAWDTLLEHALVRGHAVEGLVLEMGLATAVTLVESLDICPVTVRVAPSV